MPYQLIQTRTEADKVGVITLNRPQQLNALNDQLMDELGQALKAWDADEAIGCMVITGSEKAFAAGADIAAELSCNLTQKQSLHSLSLPDVDHIHIGACAPEHLEYLQIDL